MVDRTVLLIAAVSKPESLYTRQTMTDENYIFVETFKQNSTVKHFIDTVDKLKIKFSFLLTRRKQIRNAFAHLHIWLAAYAQSRHKKAAKRANFPTHKTFVIIKRIVPLHKYILR